MVKNSSGFMLRAVFVVKDSLLDKYIYFWCSKVDELLNSIVDETSKINEW